MILHREFRLLRRAARPTGIFGKSLTALLAPAFSRRARARRHVDALSPHQLRDIGIDHRLRAPERTPAARSAMSDLAPHGLFFTRRGRRRL